MAINFEFVREVGAFRWLGRNLWRQFSKRILRRDIIVTLPTGLRMRLPSASKFATEVFITQCNVDWGSEKLFADHLDPSGAVLDIGANVGYYSLYVLPVVSSVHAFEPDPRALAMLRQNLAGHPNAHVHDLAVGNRCGKARFVLERNSEVSHLVDDHPIGSEKGSYPIDVTTIDHFVAEKGLRVTGIKIDVEGADIQAIEGGLGILGTQFPLVLAETKPDERLFNLIRPLGYKVFAFVKHRKTYPFTFREILCETASQTKMLFLVPARLHQEFELFSRTKMG